MNVKSKQTTFPVFVSSFALALGCSGGTAGGEGTPPGSGNGELPCATCAPGGGGAAQVGGGGAGGAVTPPNDIPSTLNPSGLADLPAPTTRAARLTHAQWENSVRDLLGLAELSEFSANLREDANVGGFLFENNLSALSVDEALWQGYSRAAAGAAAAVVADPALFSALVPAGADDAARVSAFIAQFGQRVHRRPLTETEIGEYLAVYQAAAALEPGLDAGIKLLIETFLQSPHFLYRVEESAEVNNGLIPLNGYEIATRLSYMLWNTMPDAPLFAAAAAGELTDPTLVEAQVRRMLDDARAEQTALDFHRQLYGFGHYDRISPAPAFYPDAPANLSALALEESQLFIKQLYTGGLGLQALLTSTDTYVNQELAPIYGLDPADYGETLELAPLDASQRSGILTQIGFLASHSTAVQPSPIHRGVFVARHVACLPLPAPPDNIPVLPEAMGTTNRELVQSHTSAPACAACHHTLINPFGFPFENFDATGQFRDTDNDLPVDASATVTLDGATVMVNDAVGLARVLAASPSVNECYAQHWLEFAYGRQHVPTDAPLIERLGGAQLQGSSMKDLILSLVRTEAFLARSTEEL